MPGEMMAFDKVFGTHPVGTDTILHSRGRAFR